MPRIAAPTRPARAARSRSSLEEAGSKAADVAAYWLVLGSIYIAFGFLWYYSFKEKLFDQNGTMPAGLHKIYAGSLLASVPGQDAAWVMLGILEAIAFAGFAASLLAGEFLPSRRKPILLASLGISFVTFAVMLFAQAMVSQYDSVASLFAYFTGTAIVFLLVLIMPPYRQRHWLTGLLDR